MRGRGWWVVLRSGVIRTWSGSARTLRSPCQGSAQSAVCGWSCLPVPSPVGEPCLLRLRHSCVSTHRGDASRFAPTRSTDFAGSRVSADLFFRCSRAPNGANELFSTRPGSATIQAGGDAKLRPFLGFSWVFRGWLRGSDWLLNTSVLPRSFT